MTINTDNLLQHTINISNKYGIYNASHILTQFDFNKEEVDFYVYDFDGFDNPRYLESKSFKEL